MAVGQGSLEGYASYCAIGRETSASFKTYNTCTAAIDFLSSSIKTIKENRIVEQIETSRTYSKFARLSKTIEGELECYAYAESTAFNYLLQNAMGAPLVSVATATGETTGGLAWTHTYSLGDFNSTFSSLCINLRKGQSSGGMVFQYSGVRVNEFNLTAEIDEPISVTFGLMIVDSTKTSNDVSAALSVNQNEPLTFVNGRVSVENSFASLTSSSYWHVQSVELGVNNNLKADTASRRIGTDVLDILPAGVATLPLTLTIRFDTTTAYDAMLAGTQLAAELVFQGSTLTGSNQRREIKFQYPKLTIADAGDPEIGGPDEMLTSQITFNVLRDDSSAAGYAMRSQVTNLTASYA